MRGVTSPGPRTAVVWQSAQFIATLGKPIVFFEKPIGTSPPMEWSPSTLPGSKIMPSDA